MMRRGRAPRECCQMECWVPPLRWLGGGVGGGGSHTCTDKLRNCTSTFPEMNASTSGNICRSINTPLAAAEFTRKIKGWHLDIILVENQNGTRVALDGALCLCAARSTLRCELSAGDGGSNLLTRRTRQVLCKWSAATRHKGAAGACEPHCTACGAVDGDRLFSKGRCRN